MRTEHVPQGRSVRWRWQRVWMADDGTLQHGPHAVGAVGVSWSRMDAFAIVTSVRHTERVGGSRFLTNVRSAWNS
jgi:hypothetical protein